MHKVLPLLILLVLGGMVVYTITQPGANFNPVEFAYDIKPPDPPLPKPSGSTKPQVLPSPSPTPTKRPRCIADGDKCKAGIVCCDGYCDRSSGSPICKRYDGVECLPKGSFCSPASGSKQCCGGSSLCQEAVPSIYVCAPSN